MSAAIGHDPGNFYIWRASDDFAIHLGIKAITQLNAHISRARSRSGELCGILLGRTTGEPFHATLVEDLQLVSNGDDAAAGSDSTDTLLETACRQARCDGEQRVVGFFRSRRDGRLNMGREDVQTFSRLFRETGNVALLIQTSRRANESDAALFYWDGSQVQPQDFGFGFPFDAGQLVGGHPGWRYPDPLNASSGEDARPVLPHPAERMPPAPETAPSNWMMAAPSLPPSSDGGIRWGRLAPTVLIAALAIATFQFVTNSHGRVTAASTAAADSSTEAEAAAPAPAPEVVPAGNDDSGLGLTVKTEPHELEIRWNRNAPAIAAATTGTMKITEEGITENMPIDQDQLHDGYVAYSPKTNDVSIRLEVTGKDGHSATESVRAVAIP
jgi:hypothetical protein